MVVLAILAPLFGTSTAAVAETRDRTEELPDEDEAEDLTLPVVLAVAVFAAVAARVTG